jgi:rod shape-determining protein MreC
VLVSIALVTIYFRESEGGTLHGAQRIGVSVAMPFEVAGERVARPFKDAYGWASDLFSAKSENEKLKKELEEARTRLIQNETAAQENSQLRELLAYVDGPRFPENYSSVVTRVVGRPPTAYDQEIVIAAGTADGIQRNDPVVTKDGLVGLVTDVTSNGAKVTLLTDQSSAVSAMVLKGGAAGIIRHGSSDSSALVLDRVGKDELVEEDDLVITAGWRSGNLESLYPRGIPIGTVKSVGQQDVDLYKRIQVAPLVDFDSLSEVIVLVAKNR